MMKKLKVGIIGVFAFVIVSVLSNDFIVYAEACTQDDIISAYGLKFKWVKGKEYKLSMDPKEKKLENDEFEVVNTKVIESNNAHKLLTNEKSRTYIITPKVEHKVLKKATIEIKLTKSSLSTKENCKSVTVKLTAIHAETSKTEGIALSERVMTRYQNEFNSAISDLSVKSVYDREINSIKNNASTIKRLYTGSSKKSLYCNPNINGSTVTNTNEKIGNSKDRYYSANTKYFYHEGESTDPETVELTYNYSPTTYETVSQKICSTTCEEAVKVEYGPPAASMAGLCFEYSVRITSYVRCKAKKHINDIDLTKYNYCTPYPNCHNGVANSQAGPNDEFDSCIQECDGGKYTRSCSNKCYKKIYENNSSSVSNMRNYLMDDVNVSRLKVEQKSKVNDHKADCPDSDGCYYYDGNTIKWATKEPNTKSEKRVGRWYRLNDYEPRKFGSEDYYSDSNGFYRADYGGSTCHDYCTWNGCGKDTYLNKGQAQEDADKHVEDILDALSRCEAHAKCSTTTNTVTIKANYATYDEMKTGGNVLVSSGNHSECNTKYNYTASFGDATVNSNNKEGTSVTFNNKDNIIIDRNACYDKNSTDTEKYLTEWTFPGTYLNAKNNATTFNKNEAGTGYLYYDKKFCLPANIASVNTEWFDTFINAGQVVGWNETDSRIKHNIIATARKFGYFDWNFDINCFFGVNNAIFADENSSGTNSSGINSDKCIKTSPRDNYSFRIVDKDDLFAGRNTIGNNWTSNAQNPKLAGGYNENPEDIAKAIKEGRDSEVDYVFNLDKKALSKLKKEKTDYSTFDGNFALSANSVYYYQSKIVNELGGRKAQLGVNNNYK